MLTRSASQSTIEASFQGYANSSSESCRHWWADFNLTGPNQRQRPDEPARQRNEDHRHDLRFKPATPGSPYPPNSMQASVIGYSYPEAAHGAFTRLVLTIQILRPTARGAHPETRARSRSTSRRSRSPTTDARTHKDGLGERQAPQYVQGWDNADGGRRESPPFGGPPNGGRWAIVKISP